ncbi:hypothetical protein, partial [Enterobacter cloacae complex sp. 2DZ2F20B]|uniref:hypothetical protein n=1 Tax=Enterobacter cloacae complex sp. 2DZ2F20B TaxID=2511993 RepID=UPI001CA4F89C
RIFYAFTFDLQKARHPRQLNVPIIKKRLEVVILMESAPTKNGKKFPKPCSSCSSSSEFRQLLVSGTFPEIQVTV